VSPAATLTNDQAERAVLEAADRLFYERGIAGVGMADVRDASGVSLRRLYALHSSKRDLVAAWLDDRHVRWMGWFGDAVDRHVAAGVDPLLAPFDALDEWVSSPGYRGCAFLNAIAETTEIDDGHRDIVARHKLSLTDDLSTLVQRSGRDTPWLAEALAVLVDGAIVQSAALRSPAPIAAARAAATSMLAGLS
jgi:AcrR family transcriptional regulator